MSAMMPPTGSPPAPVADGAGEKASDERVELGHPILGNVDDHLLVLGGSGICI